MDEATRGYVLLTMVGTERADHRRLVAQRFRTKKAAVDAEIFLEGFKDVVCHVVDD